MAHDEHLAARVRRPHQGCARPPGGTRSRLRDLHPARAAPQAAAAAVDAL